MQHHTVMMYNQHNCSGKNESRPQDDDATGSEKRFLNETSLVEIDRSIFWSKSFLTRFISLPCCIMHKWDRFAFSYRRVRIVLFGRLHSLIQKISPWLKPIWHFVRNLRNLQDIWLTVFLFNVVSIFISRINHPRLWSPLPSPSSTRDAS